MGLIGTATLLGAGYVLGARAGTSRYAQIVATARRVAARPEVQPYLGPLAGRLRPPAVPTVGTGQGTVPPGASHLGASTSPQSAGLPEPALGVPGAGAAVLPEPASTGGPAATGGIGRSRLRRRATAPLDIADSPTT